MLISNDVRDLMVKPIERMTEIVKKLAGTVCLLTNTKQPPSTDGTVGKNSNRCSIVCSSMR